MIFSIEAKLGKNLLEKYILDQVVKIHKVTSSLFCKIAGATSRKRTSDGTIQVYPIVARNLHQHNGIQVGFIHQMTFWQYIYGVKIGVRLPSHPFILSGSYRYLNTIDQVWAVLIAGFVKIDIKFGV